MRKHNKNTCNVKPVPVRPEIHEKVKSWFFCNLMADGGYTVKMQRDELLQVMNSCPVCRNNSTVWQCINWIKNRYNETVGYEEIRISLIDCINNYANI